MAGEIPLENGLISNSEACDLDLGSGHTAYHRASLIDLYLHSKFHWNGRNFFWTDWRTDGRTFETHFITHFIRWTQKSWPNQPVFVWFVQQLACAGFL